jgi:hypothetical protein
MSTDWTKVGVSGTIFIWNPRINQYASFNSNNPSSATNGGSRYIGPGQAFFLKATSSNPVLNINELVKSSQFPDTLMFRNGLIQNQLRLTVSNAQMEISDEVVIGYDEFATESFEDAFDATKPILPDVPVNISAINDIGEEFSAHIFNAPDLESSEKVIPLNLNAIAGVYEFQASQLSSFGNGVSFYLKDEYKGTTTRLIEGLKIAIEVNENPASIKKGRLKLIIKSTQQQQEVLNEMQVWPNPSDGSMVNFSLGSTEQGDLKLYNILGAEVRSIAIKSAGNGIVQTNISELPSGVYTAVWTSGTQRLSARVTKK